VIFGSLRLQHETALASLIHDESKRKRVATCLAKIFDEGERLCRGTAMLRELTPRSLDAISSLGERLSAPMISGALSELGTPSESVESTELIVTDCARCSQRAWFRWSPGSSARRKTAY
jgi:aspartokinase